MGVMISSIYPPSESLKITRICGRTSIYEVKEYPNYKDQNAPHDLKKVYYQPKKFAIGIVRVDLHVFKT